MMQDLYEWLGGGQSRGLGSLQFDLSFPLGLGWALVFILIAGLAAAALYWPQLGRQPKQIQITLAALRALTVALILFLLIDPCVIGQRLQPGEQTVVLLFDDSMSMQVRDSNGESRSDRLLEAYDSASESFGQALKQRFNVAKYRFGAQIDAVASVEQNSFRQPQSDLVQAINRAWQENHHTNVSAVVLFSDGVQHRGGPIDINLVQLPDAPVFAVGTGDEGQWKDARIQTLSVNRTHFDSSPVNLTVDVGSDGLEGETLDLELLEGGRVIQTKPIDITEAEQTNQARFEFTPQTNGWLEYELRLSVNGQLFGSQPGEETLLQTKENILQNNSKSFVIDNRKTEYNILFYSGRPNWQHKFVRRALLEDEQLNTASLILISKAERKFVFRGVRTTTTNPLFDGFEQDQGKYGRYDEPIYLRLGVSEDELVNGYPREAEGLFPYHLVIWNEADLDDLTLERLELTREFVDKRGGAFLLIGGEAILQDSQLSSSPIGPMLPVLTDYARGDSVYKNGRFWVEATNEGFVSGAWTLDPDENLNQQKWSGLPALFRYHPFQLTRAGAEVMAKIQQAPDELDGPPFYAVQRYGAGKTAVLSSPETWPWQMNTDLDDGSHEQLWRQIVRSLAANAPQPIALRQLQNSYLVDSPIQFDVLVRDPLFDPQEAAQTQMTVTAPSGQNYALGVEESLDEVGEYRADYTPTESGVYRLSVEAMTEEGDEIGARQYSFLVEPDLAEFQSAKYNPAFLQMIADKSGGEFLTLNQLSDIPSKIPFVNQEEAEWVRIHLWHNPFFYGLLVALLCCEWYLRRTRGEA